MRGLLVREGRLTYLSRMWSVWLQSDWMQAVSFATARRQVESYSAVV